MSKTRIALITCTLLATAALGVQVKADDTAAAGRQIASKYENAIIKAQLVTEMSMSMDGRESKRESKTETTATIIDPSGLAVVSLSAINPAETYTSMGFGEDLNLKSQVTDVKFRLSDGNEIQGKIVLRDKDLDLAFIRPSEKPEKPFQCVDLSQNAKPDRLDQIFVVSRLGKVAGRALSVCLDRVQAIVEKPRTFYVPSFVSMVSDMGAPVFSTDGKMIGLLVLRTMPRGGEDSGFGMGSSGALPMILPTSDIIKVAKQAPENELKTVDTPSKPKASTPAKPVQAKPAGGKKK